jgi:DNA-binding CsgD family transcriptional regulator
MIIAKRNDNWVANLSERVLGLTQVDDIRKTALLYIEPILRAHKSIFFLGRRNEYSLKLTDIVARGIENKYLDHFREHYYRMDPFINVMGSLVLSPTPVYTTDQIVPYKRYVRTAYYNEFIKPQDIYSEMIVYLTSGTHFLGALTFCRPPGRPVFSEEDRNSAQRILPYLRAALDRALALEDGSQKDTIIRSILSGLPDKGILLMEKEMELVYVSETAQSVMSLLSPERVPRRMPTRFEMPTVLSQWLDQCKKTLRIGEHPEVREQRLELPIKNTVHHISACLRFVCVPRQRPFFVLTLESTAPELRVVQFLRKIGLTKRETDVVFLVCEGLSNAQISKKLFISEHTVANHMRSVYEKLRVSNRTSLAHYVSNLSLPASGSVFQYPANGGFGRDYHRSFRPPESGGDRLPEK